MMNISKTLRNICFGAIFATSSFVAYAGADNPDTIVTKNVETNLKKAPALEGLSLSVSTKDGVVTVSGDVKTEDQKDLIKKIVKETPGVKDIDTDELTETKSEHPISDSVITSKIKALFLKEKITGDKTAPNLSIDVETKNGVVYLTGNTENEEQLKKAVEISRSVKGVKDVDSKVRTGNTPNQPN